MERTGFVLEGGGMRGIYTAGVLDEMMDWGVRPDGILGVSAGAIHGATYVAGQKGRNIRYTKKYCRNWRFMSLRSLLLTGDLVGRAFSYEELPYRLDPFDFDAFFKSPVRFYALATDVETGEAVCLDGKRSEHALLEALRASSSMPLVSTIVSWEGRRYLDGGTADSIPLKRFEEMGYTRCLVVRTQPEGFVKQPDRSLALMRMRYRRYPAFVRACERRHEVYNASLAYADQAQAEGRALVLCPSRRVPIGRVEKNPEVLEAQYQLGRADAREARARIEAFLRAE